ncbi:MAG: DUF4340 domain-containing protein [Myxococcales bacterium]|nr:DUF4340 domain-containing protein [Myxococcales bacterium]
MKSLIVHFILASAGLASAYAAWTGWGEDGDAPAGDSVLLFECGADAVARVVYRTEAREITLERRGEGDDRHYWATVARIDSGKPSPESGEAAPTPTAEGAEGFALSKEVQDYLKEIAPLRAERSLGELDPTQLEEVKLKAPTASFELTCGGKTAKLDVGSSAFGSGDHYVREANKKTVYLLAKKALKGLDQAESQLMQRDLVRAPMTEVEHLVVRALGKERKLLHRNRIDPRQATWVDAAEPDRRNELFSNWLEKYERLTAGRYLGPNEKPGDDIAEGSNPGAFEELATIEYLGPDGKTLDRVTFGHIPGEIANYYAKSSATRAWVRLTGSVAKDVAADLPTIVGAESAP